MLDSSCDHLAANLDEVTRKPDTAAPGRCWDRVRRNERSNRGLQAQSGEPPAAADFEREPRRC
jgi:hypothetical protein